MGRSLFEFQQLSHAKNGEKEGANHNLAQNGTVRVTLVLLCLVFCSHFLAFDQFCLKTGGFSIEKIKK